MKFLFLLISCVALGQTAFVPTTQLCPSGQQFVGVPTSSVGTYSLITLTCQPIGGTPVSCPTLIAGPTEALTVSWPPAPSSNGQTFLPPEIDVKPEIVPFKGAWNVWTGLNDFTGSAYLILPPQAPAQIGGTFVSSQPCPRGAVAWDSAYFYICNVTLTTPVVINGVTNNGTWMRVALTIF